MAEWIKDYDYDGDYYYCSECGHYLEPYELLPHLIIPNECPDCGAKMDGKEEKWMIALSQYYDFYAIDEYCCEEKVLLRPHKVIGKPCGAKIYKKHIYFHCRSMLR